MDPSESLRRLRQNLDPAQGAKERIKARMNAQIGESAMFEQVRSGLNPSPKTAADVWLRVRRGMGMQPAITALGRIRRFLDPTPSQRVMLRERVFGSLRPQQPSFIDALWKWSAAVAAVAIVVRVGPMLLTNTSLAPRTSASAEVVVSPMGQVSFLQNDEFWQPIDGAESVSLQQAGVIRTDEGHATITFPNYGLLRMDSDTVVAVEDVSAGLQPAPGSTVKLIAGRIWVQGLLPSYLRGIRITAGDASVEVHEGSVSIALAEDGTLDVSVWNRSATVARDGQSTVLVTGERLQGGPGIAFSVKNVDAKTAVDAYTEENVALDSLRRKEVAQLQLERRVANAGILPTSPLYVVKRAAEAVDRALTFTEQGKIEKQLVQAETRLNEAAALLTEGAGEEADTTLEEYKQSLLAISSSGSDLVRSLLHQEVAESTADVAAALPDDDAYALKQTVLEASAALPDGFVDARRVEGVLLLDTLAALDQAVTDGDLETASVTFEELQPYLTALKADQRSLPPDVRKEAMSSLSVIAGGLVAQAGEMDIPEELLAQMEAFAPVEEAEPAVQRDTLSDDEVANLAQRILRHVTTFETRRAQENTIIYELKQLKGNPDEERILISIYQDATPWIGAYVREALKELRGTQPLL